MKASKKTRARRKSVKALDDAARIEVFERDGGKCVRCGTDRGIQWAHVFSRGDKRIRWNSDNALTLCGGCHMFWWHKHPAESGPWFAETFPDRYSRLLELRRTAPKLTAKDLKELAANA
jgi:5-methylcytosine-specific restriction endonuclease McrA